MTAEIKKILVAARAKIADPKHWTQNQYARDANGCMVQPEADNACQWCAAGAIISAVWDGKTDLYDARKILEHYANSRLTIYNDTHSHEDVLALFDRALRR